MAGLERLQRAICPSFPSYCSPPYRTVYRSANTGQTRWRGSYYPEQSIPFNELLQHDLSDNDFKAAVDLERSFFVKSILIVIALFLPGYQTMIRTHLR